MDITPFLDPGQIILIDKPLYWTSFDVVKKIRSKLKIKKIGHAGTLDPLATGLLIICTGRMTKKINQYQESFKIYIGELEFGKTTPSYDLETNFDKTYPTDHITLENVREQVAQFVGHIKQKPPAYSAVKVSGKRSYDLARKGLDPKHKERDAYIEEFSLLELNDKRLKFQVKCSKGTYIRSLAHDLGQALDSGAYLSALRRTFIGEFSVDNAKAIDEYLKMLEDDHT